MDIKFLRFENENLYEITIINLILLFKKQMIKYYY